MLENKGFVEWANENLVVVVGHNEENHATEYEDDKGKKQPGCPLYHGLTCEQHRAIPSECMNPGEGLPKVQSGNMMPNSWLVTPSGEVSAIESADQQSAGKIEDLVTEMQKAAGKVLSHKAYTKYLESFEASDTALREGNLKDALKELMKVEKDAKKLPDGLNAEVDARVDAVNAKAVEQFEAIKAGDAAEAMKAANKLKTEVGARMKRGYLPIVEDIKTWLKEAKAGE
ncbi:MAG: hypothetical protein O2894_14090 [Planctomycetota bacterium]|nr:hypothetical protein [Planctomycetota bacterium]